MKKLIPLAASTLGVAAALFIAGCETDGAAPKAGAVNFADADIGEAPAGVKTVVVTIDSSPPDAAIVLNGVTFGFTPRDVHLEVDAKGRLVYPIEIDVTYRNVTRQVSVGARTADGHTSLAAGDRVPSRIDFNGDVRVDSTKPAPWDKKPTAPSTSNQKQDRSALPPTGSGNPNGTF